VAALGATVATAAIVVIGALVFGVVVGRSATSANSAVPQDRSWVGRVAPDFTAPRLGDGSSMSLDSLRGRPVVVNFFASWCPPCRQELPVLAAAQRRADGRVVFVGVDVADSAGPASALVKASGVAYPVVVDPNRTLSGARYNLAGLPDTFLISPTGHVANVVRGPVDQATLRRWLAE